MRKSGEFSARWRGERPALSYIRGKAVALYGCGREKAGDDRRESARRREVLLFLIAAGWERGKPFPLYSDEWDGDVPAVSNARRRGRFSSGLRRRGDLSPASSMQLRGGGRDCSSLSPQGGSGGSRFLCTAANGKGTFRLFPMRGGELTAYGAVNIAAAHWKFARKLARPPSWFRVTWVWSERLRPYCFPVRAGWGCGRMLFAFFVRSIFARRVRLRRALPAPAKEP